MGKYYQRLKQWLLVVVLAAVAFLVLGCVENVGGTAEPYEGGAAPEYVAEQTAEQRKSQEAQESREAQAEQAVQEQQAEQAVQGQRVAQAGQGQQAAQAGQGQQVAQRDQGQQAAQRDQGQRAAQGDQGQEEGQEFRTGQELPVREEERKEEKPGKQEVKSGAEDDREEDGREEADESEGLTVSEDGEYIQKEEVALYLHEYGHLPGNYITKREAQDMGWYNKKGNLNEVAPGKSIGGSHFGNYEGMLPEAKGRKYYECDLEYEGGYRGPKRLIYSNDGLIFYTEDHYQTFEQLYPCE